jgi:hypothetical protein
MTVRTIRTTRRNKIDSAAVARAKLEIQLAAYEELMSKQSAPRTLLGSLLGLIPSVALFACMEAIGDTLLWVYLLPAAFIGYGARLLGHCFEWRLTLIPASVTLVTYVSSMLLIGIRASDSILVLLCIGIAMYSARKPLNEIQEKALWQAKLGRFRQQTQASDS